MSLTDAPAEIVRELPHGLLDRLIAHLNPQRVILFGSRATGAVHKDSDWDFVVVVDDDIAQERLHWSALHDARSGIRAAIDLVPFRESTFLDRVDIVGSLPWLAANKGLVVYERQEAR
jgi:predicted nucleotidyltransferase